MSELASIINPILKGWCNYYRWSNAAEHFVQIDRYVQERITRLLRKKRQKRSNANRDYHAHFFRGIGIFFLSGNVKRLLL
ncbi:group II intron maturase-specific domain-containing protein [Virgibacillus ainsalahensis]